MRLTVKAEVEGVTRAFDLMLDDLKEFDTLVLKPFSKEKREEVQQRFASGGPGWPGLAAETLARRETNHGPTGQAKARSDARMRSKLRREIRRADRSRTLSYLKASAEERGKLLARSTRNVAKRRLVLAEFERLAAGGSATTSITGDKAGAKRVGKLLERMGRSDNKANAAVLGKIASSISAKVGKGTLTLESKIPWAGIHNEGGTAGKGASIPARTFLEWTNADIDRVVELAQEAMLLAWE